MTSSRLAFLSAVAALFGLALFVGVRVRREAFNSAQAPSRFVSTRRHSVPAIPSGPERMLPAPASAHTDTPQLPYDPADGWIGADDNGRLVVTPDARWFFDSFFRAVGDSDEIIRARIVDEIERRLPPKAAREAVALLDRYLDYREGVRRLAETRAERPWSEYLQAMHDLRVEVFGGVDAATMFGAEEQVERASMERNKVMYDSSLSALERRHRLQAIEAELPAPIRTARADSFASFQFLPDEQALRAAGGTVADIHVFRVQRFGEETAARLAATDPKQADWLRRLEEYKVARRGIEADTSLSEAGRADALEALLIKKFSALDHEHVEALTK